jgi:iron complex transport system permease protein
MRPESKTEKETLRGWAYAASAFAILLTAALCVSVGSVDVPVRDLVAFLEETFSGKSVQYLTSYSPKIISIRLPRVLCAAFSGAALSVCGAAMQGLLRNPLAEGTTLGVSSGACLGAALAIVCGFSLPGAPLAGTTIAASLAAFLSIALVILLAYRLDRSLSSNTIILLGVIFSMFASSVIMIITVFAPDKVKDIAFWTMGSFQGVSWADALLAACAAVVFGIPIFMSARELNALSIGEDVASSIGVDIKKTRLRILICVSALIGICVSIEGTIGFVGLVVPHMMRIAAGPNHKKLLPLSAFFGAVFLMLTDLLSRTVLRPLELPVGAVTSMIGTVVFIAIFAGSRRRER